MRFDLSRRIGFLFQLFTTLMLLSGCAAKESVEKDAPAETIAAPAASESVLEVSELGSTPNVHVFGPVMVSGQPAIDDLPHIKDRGIEVVVSLREEGEIEWDQAGQLAELDIAFERVAFRDPEDLTDAVFDRVRELLRQADDQPLLLHCGSANRVGAVWLAPRVLDHDISVDRAIAEAKEVGLKTPEYQERALDYIQRHR